MVKIANSENFKVQIERAEFFESLSSILCTVRIPYAIAASQALALGIAIIFARSFIRKWIQNILHALRHFASIESYHSR